MLLDEEATVRRIAEEQIWLPVLTAPLEPWLEVALVIDESPSVRMLWQKTSRDLKKVLDHYGAFRDVQTWGLVTVKAESSSEQVKIRRDLWTKVDEKRCRDPKELIDPNGRRLILILSDCISSIWQQGTVLPVLDRWANRGSVAIVQVLPTWLWSRTSLENAIAIECCSPERGIANQYLKIKAISFWDEEEISDKEKTKTTKIKIPVVSLQPETIVDWSQMLVGQGTVWARGVAFEKPKKPKKPKSSEKTKKTKSSKLDKEETKEAISTQQAKQSEEDYAPTEKQISAEERVRQFRMSSSPTARKLAGFLALSPVISLPVVRLLQFTMLPESRQAHVAEVFLGGLLKAIYPASIEEDTNPEEVLYDFIKGAQEIKGVREIILDTVPVVYQVDVIEEISQYVEEWLGKAANTFSATLEINDLMKPFAEIREKLLERFQSGYFRDLLDSAVPELFSAPSVALIFDGQDDYVSLGNPDVLNFAGEITIEAWIKPQDITKTQNIVAHGFTMEPNAEVFLRIAEAEREYQIGSWDGGEHRAAYPIPPEDLGKWVHLAGSYDGKAWNLYHNGKKVGESIAATGAIQVNESWMIAAAANKTERFFHGQVSEVRIWNKARSQEEIQANRFRRLKGSEPGLVGYWPLNVGEGITAQDWTVNRNSGQIVGAQWIKPIEIPEPVGTNLDFAQGELENSEIIEGSLIVHKNGKASFALLPNHTLSSIKVSANSSSDIYSINLMSKEDWAYHFSPRLKPSHPSSLFVQNSRISGAWSAEDQTPLEQESDLKGELELNIKVEAAEIIVYLHDKELCRYKHRISPAKLDKVSFVSDQGDFRLLSVTLTYNVFELFAGEYICAVKWDGDAGTWREGTEHLIISQQGEVQFRSRFPTTTIKNLKVTGNTLSWSAEDNETAAEFTFKEDSDNVYFWEEGLTGRLFEGWLQYPNEGPIDFRGRRYDAPTIDLQTFEFDIVEFLPTFEFETVTVDAEGEETGRSQGRASYFTEDLAGVPLEMVAIPGGSFVMGSPEDEPARTDDEGPQHQVTVPAFFMGKYPVTQAQWKAVAAMPQVNREIDPDPANFKGDDRPVETVRWEDAVEFCDRLSKHTGRSYRLPSEAEWEYACRAGTQTPFYFGETLTAELANYGAITTYRNEPAGEYRQETTPVGNFPPNAFGLYDMHGNVWEWCEDLWHENYQDAPIDGSAWLNQPIDRSSEREESSTAGIDEDIEIENDFEEEEEEEDNENRVLRGGSWLDSPEDCRSAYRFYGLLGSRYYGNGFRVVCSAPRT